MMPEIRFLRAGEEAVLKRVSDGVFDDALRKVFETELLDDSRHHLCVALQGDVVVGFASAVHYIHPDKPRELWINEIGVATAYRRRGIAQALLSAVIEMGRSLGCSEAWVLTESRNAAARALYRRAGGIEETGIVQVSFPLNP